MKIEFHKMTKVAKRLCWFIFIRIEHSFESGKWKESNLFPYIAKELSARLMSHLQLFF